MACSGWVGEHGVGEWRDLRRAGERFEVLGAREKGWRTRWEVVDLALCVGREVLFPLRE